MLIRIPKRAPRGSGRPWAKELGAKKALRADGRETDEYRVFSLKEGASTRCTGPREVRFPSQ
jgi:hypothetical protein